MITLFRQSLRQTAVVAVLGFFASSASALTVTYEWAPNAGQGGTGFIELTSNAITDGANFSGIDASALTGLSYTWDNGATIDLTTIVTNNVTTWEAANGFLINGFQITATSIPATVGTFSLQMSQGLPGNPGPAFNATNSVLYGAEGNAGQWVLGTVVPIPAAVWLFGSALVGLGWLRRKPQ